MRGSAALALVIAKWGARTIAALAPASLVEGYSLGIDGRVLGCLACHGFSLQFVAMSRSRSASATAFTACCISLRPIAPMQPTRNVSTCVSLPG